MPAGGPACQEECTNNLIAELRRRNVFRVAVAYAVVAWVLIQAADILLGNFGAPDWVFKSFVALLLLGFPLALFLSWAYELTPEGVKRTEDVTPEESVTPRTGRGIDRLIVASLLAVIGLLVVERVWVSGQGMEEAAELPAAMQVPERRAPARSIAVLAFEDLSPERDQGYFAEGISEELLNLLARIEDFKVAARTSSFKFKDSKADIGEIGRALNVETVLEGSVRKAGNQVRITAQLVEVDSGYHLWSESYDRRLENIFAVQDEIAAAIVGALRLKLDIGAETATRTRDVVAYDHYLRGRQAGREPTRAGLLEAIEEFERAIAIDPGFAAAYAGIADAWVWLEDYGGFKSAEAFPRAEQAARRALVLDPQSAEAHAAMAFVLDRYYNDKLAAKDYFERTLKINPNYVTAYNLYGDTLRDLGEMERMIEVQRAAVDLDPLSVFMKSRLASKLIILSRLDEAAAILEEILSEHPGNDFAHEELGNLARDQGRLADAIREFRIVHFARPGDPFAAAQIARVGANLNDQALADAWITAARSAGVDNRWELYARQLLADWQGDWAALDEVGRLRGGPSGAYMRGVAAARLGDWPAARLHLLESLQLEGYRAVHFVRMGHAAALVELAWVEQQMGMPDWADRLSDARRVLEPVYAMGMVNGLSDAAGPPYELARVAAIQADRDLALEFLRVPMNGALISGWFLDRDPVFAAWRDDPEFRALVSDIEARVAAERAKLAGMEVIP
jgi:TolB-like protein/Tfp pilus assembly protein PilF